LWRRELASPHRALFFLGVPGVMQAIDGIEGRRLPVLL